MPFLTPDGLNPLFCKEAGDWSSSFYLAELDLYAALRKHDRVRGLGHLADVGIGYVTGGNDFFHLSPTAAAAKCIPERFLRRAVLRGRAFEGLKFSDRDWEVAATRNDSALLLALPSGGRELPRPVRDYIETGVASGFHNTFKCRTRGAWYSVPHVHEPDAFLTYMSGIFPRLVVNRAAAVAPNNLHIVRLHPLTGATADDLATAWQSSLTRLSVEIEGHSMGGGMLKLEPSEAERVLVAHVPNAHGDSAAMAELCDRLLRLGANDVVQQTMDRALLKDKLGLDENDCRILRTAAQRLRERRYFRARDGKARKPNNNSKHGVERGGKVYG